VKLVEPHAESLLVTDTPYVTVTPGAPCCMAGETDTVGFRRHELTAGTSRYPTRHTEVA
jgi:hypothetical protein